MRRRWWLLASFAGALAAILIQIWPARPLWRSAPDGGVLQGFSPDGRVLVTALTRAWLGPSEVCRWDVETGTLLSRATLSPVDPKAVGMVFTSRDGSVALVSESVPIEGTSFPTNWYLYDTLTGQRLAGPIDRLQLPWADRFSEDNRWFTGILVSGGANTASFAGVGVYSAKNGKLVLTMPERNGLQARECLFAPNGATAAFVWRDENPGIGEEPLITIAELPSGKELRRFNLPRRPWSKIQSWDGQRLVANEARVLQADLIELHTWAFDAFREPVGNGEMAPIVRNKNTLDPRNGWRETRTCVGIFEKYDSNNQKLNMSEWLDWLAGKIGLGSHSQEDQLVTGQIFDRSTGALLYQLPCAVNSLGLSISEDGRRIACHYEGLAFEVWDLEPKPRWPWSLAAGIGASAVIFAIGRWRRKRELAATVGRR